MAPRRNVSMGPSFESFQSAASDATGILIRNIKAEWQKLEKYKEVANAKEEEKISCQESLRHMIDNKNIIEKQLISAERRTQSLKSSHTELKRSLNNIRRQEDKASRDFSTEKQMLDEKLAFYQAKWRERYESLYAKKPLVKEYEKAKTVLADRIEELKFLKSDLHGCKADIFKAKCERGKRNAEESGFYPLESFIIRIASIGAEITKLETDEGELLNEIGVLQQNINSKEKLARYETQNANEVEMTKNQSTAELGKVKERLFCNKVPEESVKRKEILETPCPIPQKIIRTTEGSSFNKYSIKQSKPIQGVVAQTSLQRQKENKGFKEGIQEERVRFRMEKLKLYTPILMTPPDLLSKNITTDFDSKETRRQSHDSLISESCQRSNVTNVVSNSKNALQRRPIARENSDATLIKASTMEESRARVKEMANKTLQNIQKSNSGPRFKSFQKETSDQSKTYEPYKLQPSKEKSKTNEDNDSMTSKQTKFEESMRSISTENVFVRHEKENDLTNETRSLKRSQELFTNTKKDMRFAQKSNSSDILKKINENYKKPTRFQKEIDSPKVLREFYDASNKEMRPIKEITPGRSQSAWVSNNKSTISSNEINLSTLNSSYLTDVDKNLEVAPEKKLSSMHESGNEEAQKLKEYETRALETVTKRQSYIDIKNVDNVREQQFSDNELEARSHLECEATASGILTKHQSFRNAQNVDNINAQLFRRNVLTEELPTLQNVNKSYGHFENTNKQQTIHLAQKSKTTSISVKMLQEHTDNLDEEMQDASKKDQRLLTSSHESKNSLFTSNANQEPMDTGNAPSIPNAVERVDRDKEFMGEAISRQEHENLSKEKFPESTISMDVEENQPALMASNSSVAVMDQAENHIHENDSKVVNLSKDTLPTYVQSSVSESNQSQTLKSFVEDRINSSSIQDTTKIRDLSGTALVNPAESSEESNVVTMQETGTPNQTHESQPGISQSSQLNTQNLEDVSQIKCHEAPSYGNSELIERGVVAQSPAVETDTYPCSSKSTTSSEMQYYSTKSAELSSILQAHLPSPALEEARTPVSQVAGAAASPFDFEKHMKILGDLKKTPTFVYQTRQMYKGGNESSPKEGQSQMSQEPNDVGKDIFSTFNFFEGPTAGKDSSKAGSDKSKTDETGFLSFALEDYLSDSPDSPLAGKEKSMFSFSADSPKSNVKSPPGFFPLFAADNNETSKETKSGFVLNFGGNDKEKSTENGSSFKFLF